MPTLPILGSTFTLTAALILSGCAGVPNGALSLTPRSLQSCVTERSRLIMSRWGQYEWNTRVQVLYPDWRFSAYSWARTECIHGRPIAAHHPPMPG